MVERAYCHYGICGDLYHGNNDNRMTYVERNAFDGKGTFYE